MKELQKLSISEALDLLHKLDILLINHDEWFSELTKEIILDEDVSEEFIANNPHELCLFGKWFYNDLDKDLKELPIFRDIELIHRNMHAIFKEILVKWQANKKNKVSPVDYKEATVKRLAFRLTINTLQFKIYDYLIQTDPLTKTLNRTKMLSVLERERHRISSSGESCAVVMADIDYFKKVNDIYGHAAGDIVLAKTAVFFASVLRPMDLIFRYGGEEFLLYLSNSSKEATISTLKRTCKSYSENNIMIATGETIKITMSFGATKLNPNTDIAESIKKADTALYEAKTTGRNRVVWLD